MYDLKAIIKILELGEKYTKEFSFISSIFELRKVIDFSVTSWYRTPTRNKAVGGVPTSKHLTGLAIDVVLDNKKQEPDLKKMCEILNLKCINEGDHYHLQVK